MSNGVKRTDYLQTSSNRCMAVDADQGLRRWDYLC
jgi:glucose dehydrogenase